MFGTHVCDNLCDVVSHASLWPHNLWIERAVQGLFRILDDKRGAFLVPLRLVSEGGGPSERWLESNGAAHYIASQDNFATTEPGLRGAMNMER